MDPGFFHRGDRVPANWLPARLDYSVLVATLGALQCSAQIRSTFCTSEQDPLVELLTAGPGWRDAIPLQAGSFNRNLKTTDGKNP